MIFPTSVAAKVDLVWVTSFLFAALRNNSIPLISGVQVGCFDKSFDVWVRPRRGWVKHGKW